MGKRKLENDLLVASIFIIVATMYSYSIIDINLIKTAYQKFLISLRFGNIGRSLLCIIFVFIIVSSVELNVRGKIASKVLLFLFGVDLYNNIFELTRHGIFSILLPTILVIVAFLIIKKTTVNDSINNNS